MDRLPTELDQHEGKDGEGKGPGPGLVQGIVQEIEERGQGSGKAGQQRVVQTALVFEDPIEGAAGTPTQHRHASGTGNTTSSSNGVSWSESPVIVRTEEEGGDLKLSTPEGGTGGEEEEEGVWKDRGSPTRESRANSRASVETGASSVHSDGEEEPHYDVMKSYHDELTR